jgi:hypothetical protein
MTDAVATSVLSRNLMSRRLFAFVFLLDASDQAPTKPSRLRPEKPTVQ